MTCRALAPALLPLLTAAYEHPPIATELGSTALAPKDPDRNRTLCRALRPCNLHEVPRSAPRSFGHAQRSTQRRTVPCSVRYGLTGYSTCAARPIDVGRGG